MNHVHAARAAAILLLVVVFAAPAFAKRDRNVHIARTTDSTGAVLHTVRCVDIIVHLRDRQWVPSDSALFYSERTKVGRASATLLPLVDSLKSRLAQMTSHSADLIAAGTYTRETLNRDVRTTQERLENLVNAQTVALARLEDYQHVENAVRAIQRGRTP